MPKIEPFYQQQRQTIGNHTNRQDKQQGSQQQQDQRVKRLANQPGLHNGSVHRQNATQAMVQLLSILNTARVSAANPATIPNRADGYITRNTMSYGVRKNRAPVTERMTPLPQSASAVTVRYPSAPGSLSAINALFPPLMDPTLIF